MRTTTMTTAAFINGGLRAWLGIPPGAPRPGDTARIAWLLGADPLLRPGDGCVYTTDAAGIARLARNAERGNPHSRRALAAWLTLRLTAR
jgi:hypothetical protein